MKIAIIGAGPIGLETAINLQTMGAHIVLFSEKRGALAHSLQTWGEWPCDGSWEEITSSAGRALATQGLDIDLSNIPTLREYFDKYYSTLANQQNIQKMIKSFWVDRVHKRILMPEEFIAGKSRIIDLFRVVYHDGELERFEDFDLVIDATGPTQLFRPLGASESPALGEAAAAKSGLVHQGMELFENWESISQRPRLAIVGQGSFAIRTLLALSTPLRQERVKEIILVSRQSNPFPEIKEMSTSFQKQFFNFLESEEKLWHQDYTQVEQELKKWQNLPQHERVKIPKPGHSKPRLRVLAGYSVTAINKFSDRDGIFLTCETENWRTKNDRAPLVITVEVDAIVGANGFKKTNPILQGMLTEHLNQGMYPEDGLYAPGRGENGDFGLKYALSQIPLIREDILKYFSKA